MDLASLHAFASQPIVYLPLAGAICLGLVLLKKPFTALYVALIPFINWAFTFVPNLPMPDGGVLQPTAIVTGLVLVVRDFGQREVGHKIMLAMLAALVLSTMMTPLQIVIASGAAFLISETMDWLVYTFTKRPLSQRIMLSSLVGAPIDSALFLYLASAVNPDLFAWSTLILSVVSKLVGAAVVAWLVAQREKAQLPV